jgi:signal peptidase
VVTAATPGTGMAKGRGPGRAGWFVDPPKDSPLHSASGISFASRGAARRCLGRSPGGAEPPPVIARTEGLTRAAGGVPQVQPGVPGLVLPAETPRRHRQRPRAAAPPRGKRQHRVASTVLSVACLALSLALSIPVFFGFRALVVRSGSMEPAISTGSLVVVHRVPAESIAVGQVISFVTLEGTGQVITHRVQAVSQADGEMAVETKGDANTGSEKWSIGASGVVGRVVLHIPYLGYALAYLGGRTARLLLVVTPALALAGVLVVGIWRRPAGGGRARRSRRARAGGAIPAAGGGAP